MAGLAVATALYFAMRAYAHQVETTPPSLRAIGEGWSYAVRRKDLLGTYVVDIVCMVLAFPVVLFPALAADVFDHPQLLGLLYSAETVGALLATVLAAGPRGSTTTAGRSWSRRRRTALFIASGRAGPDHRRGPRPPRAGRRRRHDLGESSAARSGTRPSPSSMRGRLAGIEMLSYSVGPIGGQVRSGLVADAWSVRGAIASGGFACVVGVGITAVALRDFWSYDNRTDEHAIAEREAPGGPRGDETD